GDVPTQISKRLDGASESLRDFSERMKRAEVTARSGEITVQSEVPASRLEPVIQAAFDDSLSQGEAIRYEDPASNRVRFFLKEGVALEPEMVKQRLSARFAEAAEGITGAQVQTNSAFGAEADGGPSYTIVSRETSKEIVVDAILDQMEDDLKIDPALEFGFMEYPATGAPYFPIRDTDPRALGLGLTDEAA